MAMDVLQWPRWPMLGRVFSYFPALRGQDRPYTVGSATLIGVQAVLTAAHVVYDPTRGGWADMYDIYFGDKDSHRVGGGPTGNGRVRAEWIREANVSSLSMVDAGVIRLDRAATPQPAIPLPTTTLDLLGTPINVLGFPADKLVPTWYGSLAGTRTSAYDMGPQYNGFRVGYLEYTYDGMSGGPVLRVADIGNGTFVVRGVHTSLYNNLGNGLMLYASLVDQVSRWAVGAV